MGDSAKLRAAMVALLALGGCAPDGPSGANQSTPVANLQAQAAAPPPRPVPAADAPLRAWIVGTWSFDSVCASDFLIHYEPDGKLDNAGEVGRWELRGDTLTETVVERFENGADAPVKVDPPLRRRYAVARTDAGHGVITFEGRSVPILRC